jgi:hypothetical protein
LGDWIICIPINSFLHNRERRTAYLAQAGKNKAAVGSVVTATQILVNESSRNAPQRAAEGFLILGILVPDKKYQLHQYDIFQCLTAWGNLPDKMGATA